MLPNRKLDKTTKIREPIGVRCLPLVALLAFFAFSASAATFGGVEYQGVRGTGKLLGMSAEYTPDLSGAVLSSKTKSVRVATHQKYSRINGTRVWLCFPIAENKNLLYLAKLDYQKTLLPLLKPSALEAPLRLRHIVIDPGHGGKDTGAISKSLKINEKTMVLDIAKRLKANLESLGYRVSLTRESDIFLPLPERPAIANKLNADLFVSIHLNASVASVTGAETFCYTPQNAPSTSRATLAPDDKIRQPANHYDIPNLWLAYDVQKNIVRSLGVPDRGVKRARFVVLETLQCPGILIECGFLSNPTEGARLKTALYRQQVADAITSGIRSYHRRLLGGN